MTVGVCPPSKPMNTDELHAKHMAMVDAINADTEPMTRAISHAKRASWLEGLDDAKGYCISGILLMRADQEQMSRGYDGPMCGGIKP